MSPWIRAYLDVFLLFVLVLTRLGSLVMSLPWLGPGLLPWQVRAVLAVSGALLVTPLFFGQPLPPVEHLAMLTLLVVREAMLGLALGLAISVLVAGMQLAGQAIGQTSGMSLADVADPTFESSVPLASQLLEKTALVIFLLIGGHRQVLAALLDSFTAMPPGQAQLPGDLWSLLREVVGTSFEIGLRAAAPAVAALLASTLLVALLSRTLPQLNAVAVGLNLNALLVLGVLGLTVGAAAWVWVEPAQQVLAAWRSAVGLAQE
jgi:flagellar biosynthetic protein FliR